MYFSTTCKPVTSLKAATKTQRPHSDNGIQIGAQIRTQITLTAIETLRDLSIAPSQWVASTTIAHCHLRRNGAPVHWRIFQEFRNAIQAQQSQWFGRCKSSLRMSAVGPKWLWLGGYYQVSDLIHQVTPSVTAPLPHPRQAPARRKFAASYSPTAR
jgi:hypothetical protein